MKKILLLILLSLTMMSCLDIAINYRVSSNGKVSVSMKYTATNEYGISMLEDAQKSLVEEGYVITASDNSSVEGVIFTDMDSAFSDNLTNKLLNEKANDETLTSMARILKEGNTTKYIVDYEIPSNSYAMQGEYAELTKMMYSNMTFRYVVTLPATITRTNGTQTSANTVMWVTNFYDLFINGKRFYCEYTIYVA